MPQKKNPDGFELVRGKSGRVFGHLMGLLSMLKGLPSAYNKDMQEDKEAVFDATDTLKACLGAATTMLRHIELNTDKAEEAAKHGQMNATELADYLVRKGLPFRKAHEFSGQLVLLAVEKQIELEALSLDEMQSICPEIAIDVYESLSLERTLGSKVQIGGTASSRVSEALLEARNRLSELFRNPGEGRGLAPS
jgi:argininosuccinate lyase